MARAITRSARPRVTCVTKARSILMESIGNGSTQASDATRHDAGALSLSAARLERAARMSDAATADGELAALLALAEQTVAALRAGR